jgi:head-tail adaptor
LRELVTILRRADDRDDLGGAEGAWAAVATRWAAVAADGTGEAVVGEAVNAAARFRVTIRGGVAVLPGDRIGWGGRMLAVRAVIDDPVAPDRIVLMAEEMR